MFVCLPVLSWCPPLTLRTLYGGVLVSLALLSSYTLTDPIVLLCAGFVCCEEQLSLNQQENQRYKQIFQQRTKMGEWPLRNVCVGGVLKNPPCLNLEKTEFLQRFLLPGERIHISYCCKKHIFSQFTSLISHFLERAHVSCFSEPLTIPPPQQVQSIGSGRRTRLGCSTVLPAGELTTSWSRFHLLCQVLKLTRPGVAAVDIT